MKRITMTFCCLCSAAIWVALPLHVAGQLVGTAPRRAEPPSRARPAEAVRDSQIQMKLVRDGVNLVAEGKTVPRSALLLQLTRSTCTLKLPKPRSSVVSQEALAERGRSSVVIVARLHQGAEPDDWMAVPATGFFISESGVIATSRHVVSGADYQTIVVMTGDGRVVPVTQVLAAQETCDIVLLQAEISGVPALALQTRAQAGSSICVMSHPMGRFYTFTQGIVCRHSIQSEGREARELLDISADFAPGSSGAPVLDLCGNAVGWVDQLRVRSSGQRGRADGSPVLMFRECGVASDILKLIRVKR